MPIDRELLNAPVNKLRQMLEENEVPVFDAPDWLRRRIRAQFRFDLASLGMDTGDAEQLAGAIVGYGVALKALLTFVVPPELVAQFVSFFDCIEPLLDEDIDSLMVMNFDDGDFWESVSENIMKNVRRATPEEMREQLGLPNVGQPVSEAVRKLAADHGLTIPEDATMIDLSEQARMLAGGQRGQTVDAEWKMETDPEYGYRATHVASGQGVVAPTLPELAEHMSELNAALVREAAGEPDAPKMAVGGPGFALADDAVPEDDPETVLRTSLAALDDAIAAATEARRRLARGIE